MDLLEVRTRRQLAQCRPSAGDTLVLGLAWGSSIYFLDGKTMEKQYRLRAQANQIEMIAISQDGTILVAAANDAERGISLWKLPIDH